HSRTRSGTSGLPPWVHCSVRRWRGRSTLPAVSPVPREFSVFFSRCAGNPFSIEQKGAGIMSGDWLEFLSVNTRGLWRTGIVHRCPYERQDADEKQVAAAFADPIRMSAVIG